jgi:hypothetical protein
LSAVGQFPNKDRVVECVHSVACHPYLRKTVLARLWFRLRLHNKANTEEEVSKIGKNNVFMSMARKRTILYPL